jgi:hypothetical protein
VRAIADNVELDPGSGGATVATDDVGGAQYQRIKLDGGGDGAAAPILGDSANGLDVDVTRSALPSGASTSAKQPALGTAGTASADVITVQGVTSMTPLLVNGSGVTQPVSGTVTANLAAGTNNIGDVDVLTLPALPAGNNNIGDVDVASLPALAAGNNNIGDVDVATLPGSLAGIADDAAFTVATSVVLPVGYLADQASTDSVNEGDIGAARMTLDRKIIVTVAPSADTEGLTIFRTLDADETEEEVKATAGKLYGWFIYNDGAAEAYVKFYNATAAGTTVGSTTPILTIPIPAGSASNVEFTNGITFATALSIAATTGVADADTAAPAANQVIANVFYL